MKKKLVFVIYRKWAFEIFKQIAAWQKAFGHFEVAALITVPEAEFAAAETGSYCNTFVVPGSDNAAISKILSQVQADAVIFYGWSWIVKKEITENFLCLVLHPSPLPKYRGGTPVQHQIINGEIKSAVTVFKMSAGLDDGDIYCQLPMTLKGDLNDILARMTRLGVKITKNLVKDLYKGSLRFYPQKNLEVHPPLARRKPEQSKITRETAAAMTFRELANLVRALLDPYPNVYLLLPGKKILIQKVKKYKLAPRTGLVLKLKDGYARLVKYKSIKST